ncbi:hypothetical protein ABVB43_07375 [Staphylococcus cohnii]|uniref:hypothetical protein n=1 Tax=Staphylococcus cohnii TaxID=29382 RepID=UPI00374F6DD0
MDAITEIYQTIQKLLHSEITAYQIEKDTGISRAKIGRLKNGKNNINNLSLETTGKLYEYATNSYVGEKANMEEIKWNIIEEIERKMVRTIEQLKYIFEDLKEDLEILNINKVSYLLSNLVTQKNLYDIELVRYKNQDDIIETEVKNELDFFVDDLDKFLNDPSIYDRVDYSRFARVAAYLKKSKIHEHSFKNLIK